MCFISMYAQTLKLPENTLNIQIPKINEQISELKQIRPGLQAEK